MKRFYNADGVSYTKDALKVQKRVDRFIKDLIDRSGFDLLDLEALLHRAISLPIAKARIREWHRKDKKRRRIRR